MIAHNTGNSMKSSEQPVSGGEQDKTTSDRAKFLAQFEYKISEKEHQDLVNYAALIKVLKETGNDVCSTLSQEYFCGTEAEETIVAKNKNVYYDRHATMTELTKGLVIGLLLYVTPMRGSNDVYRYEQQFHYKESLEKKRYFMALRRLLKIDKERFLKSAEQSAVEIVAYVMGQENKAMIMRITDELRTKINTYIQSRTLHKKDEI